MVRRRADMPPPPAPRPTIWDRWTRITSARQGLWGIVLLIVAILMLIANGIDAAKTLIGAWESIRPLVQVVGGYAYAVAGHPVTPLVIAVVGVVLILRVPAPKALAVAPAVRPDEGLWLLDQLMQRGRSLVLELRGLPYYGEGIDQRLRHWAKDIAAAARTYLPERAPTFTVNTPLHADSAEHFVYLYMSRITEMREMLDRQMKADGLG